MKYYINQIYLPALSNDKCDCIGLFRGEFNCVGKGNFCGYYASEYFTDMFLVAYYTIDSEVARRGWKAKPHIDEVVVMEDFESVQVFGGMCTIVLDAESDGEALDMFFGEEFTTMWDYRGTPLFDLPNAN